MPSAFPFVVAPPSPQFLVSPFLPCARNSSPFSRLTLSCRIALGSNTVKKHHLHSLAKNANALSGEMNNDLKKLDRFLSAGTSAFPLIVLSFTSVAVLRPSLLLWTGQNPNLMPALLSAIMVGMGLTLSPAEFTRVLSNPATIAGGVACQYGIMPLAATIIAMVFRLPPALALGTILVGCSPGGTASNLVTLIAEADVALSVCLTAVSTILAAAATPLLVKTLSGALMSSSADVAVDGIVLCTATAKVVLVPVLFGMIINKYLPRISNFLSRFTPFASVMLVGVICGGVVAQNCVGGGFPGGWANARLVSAAVGILHAMGFAAGYILPRKVGKCSLRTSRTISIETGMQNSALAVVLAQSLPGVDALAALPGAVSATVHSCLGSLLATIWRIQHGEDDVPDTESRNE